MLTEESFEVEITKNKIGSFRLLSVKWLVIGRFDERERETILDGG